MTETVLTTRRARYRIAGRRWTRGRLRLTDRRLLVLTQDGGPAFDAALDGLRTVRVARSPRASIVLGPDDARVLLRCFEVAAVAALIRAAAASRDDRAPEA